MPSKLLDRMREFLDETPATVSVMPAQGNPVNGAPPHWPGGTFGATITNPNVQTVVIHETTGYPTYQSSNGFIQRYTSQTNQHVGEGPQYYVDGNGTIFRLIDIDPVHETWHATYVNAMSVGIENGDLGDDTTIGPDAIVLPGPNVSAQKAAAAQAYNRNFWRALSANAEDLTSRKAYMLLHPGQGAGAASANAEGVLIWFGTAHYDGPQDMTGAGAGFRRMLFTERDYRSLVLLCRYLAEQLQIPRNFAALPYEQMEYNIDSVASFRKIVVSDERADMIAAAAGTTVALLKANDQHLATWYTNQIQQAGNGFKRHNTAWRKMVDNSVHSANKGGFRGFHGHGFAGDIFTLDNHSLCPGPFFDWHRFAREVWDWWWYCFDFVADSPPMTTVHLSTAQREYRKARRATALREYYYDADGKPSDYTAARLPADSALTGANSFAATEQTPIFAMANGVLVAACIPNATPVDNQASTGFVLVRHEIFCEANGNNINYDLDPTYVYSLTHYVQSPQIVFDNISDNNPDWFNRFLIRLKETELAVALHTAQLDDPLRAAWGRAPTGAGGRPQLGDQISTDAAAYRQAADLLGQGKVAIFPLELRPGATPVRVILGDLLGFPGAMGNNNTGVLVDIFSVAALPQPFVMNPPPVPAGRQIASPITQAEWWSQVCGYVALEQNRAKELPFDGVVWHYDMIDFLAWINGITWRSEWPKYGVVDVLQPDGPDRPKSRK